MNRERKIRYRDKVARRRIPKPDQPRPFEHEGKMYVRIPEVGLCRMDSWGWTPVPEFRIRTH